MPILKERSAARRPSRKTPRGTRSRRSSRTRKTTDALKIIDRITGDDPELRRVIADASINAEVAQMIYDARTAAGLTQEQLARRVGTKQPVIARLEDADYEGHSLTMLRRVADALHKRLEVRLLTLK
jgi:ribosome-binding protein aMBF1 (putative translation factor)